MNTIKKELQNKVKKALSGNKIDWSFLPSSEVFTVISDITIIADDIDTSGAFITTKGGNQVSSKQEETIHRINTILKLEGIKVMIDEQIL